MDINKILELIEKKKNKISEGRKYYYYKPKQEEKEHYYQDGKAYTEKKEGDYIYTNWVKVLVDQKIDYSLAKPITYDVDNMPEQFNINDLVTQMSHNASIDSICWTQLIINSDNKMDWIIVEDKNVIGVYDKNNKYLTNVIKFWEEKKEDKIFMYVQDWDSQKFIQYIIYEEKVIEKKTQSHYMQALKYNDVEEKINPKGFGFIPFLPLYNNKNKESDVDAITILAEVYNQISSGFVKNVKKFEELIYILKGYQSQDLDQFTKLLREYNVVPIDNEGDLSHLEVKIPVEARQALLAIAKENIFLLGRGVDPAFNFSGKDITNVLIKSYYHPLDTKCSDFEKQIRIYYKELIFMINTYNKMNIDNSIEFTRNQIFNVSEQIDNCLKSLNMISLRTVLENHPFVDDVEEELKRIKEDNIFQKVEE